MSETKPIAWSISALDSFETCNKRFYHLRVAKDVKDVKGVDADWGTWVHKQFENRLRHGTALPLTLAGHEKLVEPIANAPGTKLVEAQMAVNKSLEPCDWFAKDTWCRVVVDAGVISDSTAVLFDWKTGKPKAGSDQLALSAAVTMSHNPHVQRVRTAFVWLQNDKTDRETYTRNDLGAIWGEFLPRVSRLERAYTKAQWPAKPSGLCRKHCPVPKHLCEYSGK